MEVRAAQSTAYMQQAEQMLKTAETQLKPAYKVAKIGRLVLGDAPISFGSTITTTVLKKLPGSSEPRLNSAIGHTGLAVDGVLRGTLYSGGILHNAAAKSASWLVSARAAPTGFSGFASLLGRVAKAARFGVLSIGGVLGAIKAARAVTDNNGDLNALYKTHDGRAGVLQAAGSVLLLVNRPAAYFMGAVIFAGAALNDLL